MKQSFIYLLAIFFAVTLGAGCNTNNPSTTAIITKDSSAGFDSTAMRKIIDEKNAAFAKAFTTGDSAGMVNNYTVDGKIFAPNTPLVSGRAAIAALVSAFLKFGIKEFSDSTAALYGAGDKAVEEGRYFMGDGKGHTIDKGKYIVVWSKSEGDWKVYSDIFNSSLPVPVPAK